MPRIRSLKYEFFINEDLAQISPEARLLGLGLTTIADREGRLEDRPMRIKVLLFPYHDVDVNDLLNELQSAGFLTRYHIEDKDYIHIVKFKKHQHPHPKEPDSALPDPLKATAGHGGPRLTAEGREETGGYRGGYGNGYGGGGGHDAQPAPSAPRRKVKSVETSPPDFFPVTEAMRRWITETAPQIDPDYETEKFLDKAREKGWTAVDWTAKWRTWVRKAVEFQKRDAPEPQMSREERARKDAEIARRMGYAG